MSRIKSSNNKSTEIKLQALIERAEIKGWQKDVTVFGKPDFVWPDLKVAVFVDGCYWHGHDCSKGLKPKSNQHEWSLKILTNQKRDRKVDRELKKKGWSVIRIWECHLKKDPAHCLVRIKRILTLRRNKEGFSL